jgi:ABC-type sugar transport system permease subunit
MMVGLMVVPLLATVYLSFTRYSYGNAPVWTGLANYATVLEAPRFWNSLRFTGILIAFAIPGTLLLGFAMALLLDRAARLQGLIITGALLPNVVTPVVGTLIFSWLFQDRWGFYWWLMSKLGITIHWFAGATSARALLIIHAIWGATPFVFLVLYAGLQAMSREQLESAALDGANFLQRLRYIIFPTLRPLFVFVIMVELMDMYRAFDSVYVMTRGGPGSSTETVMFYNYDVAFAQFRLGLGSAVSVLTVVGIVILLLPFLFYTYRQQTQP